MVLSLSAAASYSNAVAADRCSAMYSSRPCAPSFSSMAARSSLVFRLMERSRRSTSALSFRAKDCIRVCSSSWRLARIPSTFSTASTALDASPPSNSTALNTTATHS